MTLKEMLNSPEAKKAYREIAKNNHPDLKKGNPDLMRKANELKASKKNKDAEMLKLSGKNKKSYDDTKKETPSFDYDKFDDMVWDAMVELNNIAPSVDYHIVARRSKGQIILNIHVSFITIKNDKHITDHIDFNIFNGQKLKSKEAIVSAVIDKFKQY